MDDGRQKLTYPVAGLEVDPRVMPFILDGTLLLGDDGLVWLNVIGEWMTQEQFLQATQNLLDALHDRDT